MVLLTNMMNMANIKLTSQILMVSSHIGVMVIPLPEDDDDKFYCDYDDGFCQDGDIYGEDENDEDEDKNDEDEDDDDDDEGDVR